MFSKLAVFLTDGGGVSPESWQKLLKDFVADFLISGAAALAAVNIVSLQAAVAEPTVVAFAIVGAFLKTAYRIILRWATS